MLQRSFKNASVLALVLSVLASLLPSQAQAAESCATILTDLRAQHTSTTGQLNAAIAAHTGANGRVSIQFLLAAFTAYTTQTNAAIVRLQAVAQASPITCGTTPVNTVINLLVGDLVTVATGVAAASQVVSPTGGTLQLVAQLSAQLIAMMKVLDTIYAVSHIDSKAATCAAVKANVSLVQSLKTAGFISIVAHCKITN